MENSHTKKYDVPDICSEYTIEVGNRFESLNVERSMEPDDCWNNIKTMITEVADKRIPKQERKKITSWLSKCALEIAEARRKAKANGDLTRYRQLNVNFQRQARRDKEKNLQKS